MKKKILHLTLTALFTTAMTSQGAVIFTHTYTLGTSDVDGGTFGSDTHTWTQSFTNVGGTDVSFDLVMTVSGSAALGGGTTSMGIANGSVDSGESATFSMAIANFNAGTSNYTEDIVDFGFTAHNLSTNARGSTDSGTFTLINGVAPSSTLTWTDANAGSDFTGMGNSTFDLALMNTTYGDGSAVTSFTHEWAGASWSFSQ
ncbi:MAG: hypothetical protein ACPIB0_08585, partial [Akkermansiaceae bacterium]